MLRPQYMNLMSHFRQSRMRAVGRPVLGSIRAGECIYFGERVMDQPDGRALVSLWN